MELKEKLKKDLKKYRDLEKTTQDRNTKTTYRMLVDYIEKTIEQIEMSDIIIKRMRCNFCNKPNSDMKNIILHKKVISYCPDCKKKALEVQEQFKRMCKEEYLLYESKLKKVEQKLYFDKIKKYE